jgi:hypothetical protein
MPQHRRPVETRTDGSYRLSRHGVKPTDNNDSEEIKFFKEELAELRKAIKEAKRGTPEYNRLMTSYRSVHDLINTLKATGDPDAPPVAKTPTRPRTSLDAQGPPK